MEQRFGWVEWKGGERPVPEGTTVKWMTRRELAGERQYCDVSDVLDDAHIWDRHPNENGIVAYKVIKDANGKIVNADVKEDPVSLFRPAPTSDQGYGSPLPTIALNTMVPPLSGEELVSAGVDPRFAAASYGNDLMVSGYPYAAPAGDPHEMVTFHELPAPIPTEDLQPYSNVISLPVREMASVSAGPRAGDGPPVGVGDVHSSAKGSGARFNAGKVPLELIPLRQVGTQYLMAGGLRMQQLGAARALQHLGDYQARTRGVEALYDALTALGDLHEVWRECAQVFEYGKRKYAAWNWAKGMAWSIPFGCAGRHAVFGILAGEHLDPESGKPHRGHIACNIVMLIAYAECYTEGDDRPASGLIGQAPVITMDEALRA